MGFPERAGDGARKRHFQPVENPGDAKRYDDKSVELSPAEPVEPRRDGGFDQRRVSLVLIQCLSWLSATDQQAARLVA